MHAQSAAQKVCQRIDRPAASSGLRRQGRVALGGEQRLTLGLVAVRLARWRVWAELPTLQRAAESARGHRAAALR